MGRCLLTADVVVKLAAFQIALKTDENTASLRLLTSTCLII
jgi:hypothetical protein